MEKEQHELCDGSTWGAIFSHSGGQHHTEKGPSDALDVIPQEMPPSPESCV